MLDVKVSVDEGAQLPAYSSPQAAGADLRAYEAVQIPARARAGVRTGLRVAIPPGYVGLVWPRSGLALRHGIDTLAGVVDSDYRGELIVVLANHGDEPFEIARGERIAQLLIQPVERAVFVPVPELEPTARGPSGFGSTGR
jgi:dUTP pyrophosphatase